VEDLILMTLYRHELMMLFRFISSKKDSDNQRQQRHSLCKERKEKKRVPNAISASFL